MSLQFKSAFRTQLTAQQQIEAHAARFEENICVNAQDERTTCSTLIGDASLCVSDT